MDEHAPSKRVVPRRGTQGLDGTPIRAPRSQFGNITRRWPSSRLGGPRAERLVEGGESSRARGTTHVRWSFMLTPRSVSGWLASTMLVYAGCSSPDASSASELRTHVPGMSTQETHSPDIEAPRPALDVQSFDCQDVPDLALAEQRTLLARWFADWDIRPPTKADAVWELDGKDAQAVVAHGLGEQAPAWLTAGSDFEPSTARVLGRHRVGHHWVTVVSVQHPAMSGGHPGGRPWWARSIKERRTCSGMWASGTSAKVPCACSSGSTIASRSSSFPSALLRARHSSPLTCAHGPGRPTRSSVSLTS